MRNYFPKRTSGEPLYTLSIFYYVPVGFVIPPLLKQFIAIFLWSLKGDCCSILNVLSCFYIYIKILILMTIVNRTLFLLYENMYMYLRIS